VGRRRTQSDGQADRQTGKEKWVGRDQLLATQAYQCFACLINDDASYPLGTGQPVMHSTVLSFTWGLRMNNNDGCSKTNKKLVDNLARAQGRKER